MEINDTTMTVTRLCKLFGFAPYKIVRNNLNQIVDFKLSRAMCIYSIAFIIVFSISANYALLYDLHSGHSVRMKNLVSRIVFWLDINTVSASALINVVVAMVSLKNTRRVNSLLNKIDAELRIFNGKDILHTVRVKRTITAYVVVGYFLLTTLLAFDFAYWYNVWMSQFEEGDNHFDPAVYCMIPFYLLYTAFVPMHAKFATTLYRIGLRYRCLNKIITVYAAATYKYGYFRSDYKQAEDAISRFKRIYDSLGNVLQCTSSEYGITVIILMISCLFHLICSLYHVFVDILDEQDVNVSELNMAWALLHCTRIAFIIEPCHMVAIEARKTVMCVCELMQRKHDMFVLNRFWGQLKVDNVYFSACGIVRIDRQMLTSVGTAITTYLVIALQFQR